MVTVRIAGDERVWPGEADESWINQQVNRRHTEGLPVCVTVTVKAPGLDMILSTPGCSGGGGGRRPFPQEQEVFNLWAKHGLNDPRFTGGNVVAFLKQLRKVA